jgi:hypothetical protein
MGKIFRYTVVLDYQQTYNEYMSRFVDYNQWFVAQSSVELGYIDHANKFGFNFNQRLAAEYLEKFGRWKTCAVTNGTY